MRSIVGQTVSHYVFVEKLGAGGMGEIYKARDSRLNRIVAVKVLAPGKTGDPNRRRRFIQEAQAASALNHPNIITIHDILPEGDTQYMVMEYVSGKTLQEMIRAGKLLVPQVLQLATQMANALGVAHAAGIIHRDFKPANVMVTGSGLVKILDFGLAKLTDLSAPMQDTSDGQQNTLTAAPLTREGSIMGTVNYMSPEQAEGLKVDYRSDIFSFGAVLYEMLTGHRAFDGDSGISTLSAVLRDEVKPIHEMAPEVPAELADLVNRCLRKNPAARCQSMTEVEAELTSLKRRSDSGIFHSPAVSSPSVSSPSVSSPSLSNMPPAVTTRKSGVPKAILLGAACLAVLALAIVAAWWPTHTKQTAATAASPAPVSSAPASSASVSNPATIPNPDQPPVTPAQPSATPSEPPATPAQAPATPAAESLPQHKPPAAPKRSVSPYAPAGAKLTTPTPTVSNVPKTVVAPPVPTPTATTPAAPVLPPRPVAVAPVIRSAAPAELVPVKLTDGIPFRIALVEDVPIDAEVGRALKFRVLDGVQSGDTTVIAKGSIVTGSLADLGGKKNFFGQSSKVRFRLIAAESVDDAKINVRATPASRSDGVENRPFATPNGTKDKDLIATSGTEYIAYISGDQTVSVHK
jgi:serine/threonine-protein kinase